MNLEGEGGCVGTTLETTSLNGEVSLYHRNHPDIKNGRLALRIRNNAIHIKQYSFSRKPLFRVMNFEYPPIA